MMKYNAATIQDSAGNRLKPHLKIGSRVSPGNRDVKGSFSYGFYDIEYKLIEPGVIVYTPHFNAERAAMYASIALLCILIPELFSVWVTTLSTQIP